MGVRAPARILVLLLASVAIGAAAGNIPSPSRLRAENDGREGIDLLLRGRYLEARDLLDRALAERPAAWDRYARARARIHAGDLEGARADLETLGTVPTFRTVALAWLERLLPGGAPLVTPPLRLVSQITRSPAGAVAPVAPGEILYAPMTGTGIFRASQTEGPSVFATGFQGIAQILRLSTGEIAVTDFAAGRVVILNPAGWRKTSFPPEGLLGPNGIAEVSTIDTDAMDLLVSVSGTGEVIRFRRKGEGGDFARVATYFGEAPLARPRGLLSLDDGGFLVAEAGRARILRVDAEGTVRETLSHPRLREPSDFSRDAGGLGTAVWIADAAPEGGGLFRCDTIGARPLPVVGAETAIHSVYADPNGTIFLGSARGLFGYRADPARGAWVEIAGVSARRYPTIEVRAIVRDPDGRPIWGLTDRNLRILGEGNVVRWPVSVAGPDPFARRLRLVWASPDPEFLDAPLRRLLAAWGVPPEGETRIGRDLERLDRVLADLAPSAAPTAILLLAGDALASGPAVERIGLSARANGIPIFVLHTGSASSPSRAVIARLAQVSGGAIASPFEGGATVPLERALGARDGGQYRIVFTIPEGEAHAPRALVGLTLEARYRGLVGFDRLAFRVPIR